MPAVGTVPGFKSGFRSLLTLTAGAGEAIGGGVNPANLQIWIKEINPPGFNGGGGISQTTMLNSEFETMWHGDLLTVTPLNLVVAYDQTVLPQMRFLINKNLIGTFLFPNGANAIVYGFIDDYKPNTNKKNEQPTANMVFIPSNINGANLESGPQINTV